MSKSPARFDQKKLEWVNNQYIKAKQKTNPNELMSLSLANLIEDGKIQSDPDPKTIESKYDGAYSYNACRLPYNLVQSKDATSQKLVKKMLNFFKSQRNLYAGYDLKGKPWTIIKAVKFLAP